MPEILHERGSVFIALDAWKTLDSTIKKINPSKVFVLVDQNTRVHCLPYFQQNLIELKMFEVIEIPVGEEHKNIHTCLETWNGLSKLGADRNSLIINLGGGVTTDLGGFVASCFKRGIEFINIPTSLLAMVDASVGGKNGVDLGSIKNQIGIIRQPLLVVIDTNFLQTLPKGQFISGVAEMLKHGLISSEDYLNRVFQIESANPELVTQLVWESIEIKNKIVTEDPLEKGIRKSLNFGHTLGHAIESYCLEQSDKGNLLHGEAIAIGMILALFISSEQLDFPKNKLNTISNEILKMFPKTSFSDGDIAKIIELLIYDKKNVNGSIYFVLLDEIGTIKLNQEVSNELIYKAFEYYHNL